MKPEEKEVSFKAIFLLTCCLFIDLPYLATKKSVVLSGQA